VNETDTPNRVGNAFESRRLVDHSENSAPQRRGRPNSAVSLHWKNVPNGPRDGKTVVFLATERSYESAMGGNRGDCCWRGNPSQACAAVTPIQKNKSER
jgi:hypothetical protein